ncbi:MAG: helix-turn-helix domain-containing protein [Thermoanaerobaculia bacterium]
MRVRVAFGARLAQLRRERGVRQKDLARELGIGQNLLSRYERGLHAPKLLALLKLRRLLGVTLDYLVAGAAPGEIADARVLKWARALDQLPIEHRNRLLITLAASVQAAQAEVQRTASPEPDE